MREITKKELIFAENFTYSILLIILILYHTFLLLTY